MAKCLKCEKKGMFMKVSEYKMCDKCNQIALLEVPRRVEIIQESNDIANKTNNNDTKITRLQLIMDHCLFIHTEYGKKGIKLTKFDLNELYKDANKRRVEAIQDVFKELTGKHLDKIENAKTDNTRDKYKIKMIEDLNEFKQKYPKEINYDKANDFLNEHAGIKL